MQLSLFLQKSSGIVTFLLASFLAYQLALLTWSFFPSDNFKYQWSAPQVTSINSQINTQPLQNLHVFGNAFRTEKTPKQQVQQRRSIAPKTKLNVLLVGVVAASNADFSSAIISHKGQQGSYFIGSEIADTDAKVSEIYSDRVILNVDGVLQTLMLDGVDGVKTTRSPRAKEPREIKNDEPVAIALDRKALLADPGKLTDYVRISPYRRDGEVIGYRLRPGKKPDLFNQVGFKKNDLAVALNGVDLTDKQEAFSLMKEFPTMTEINVTVERDGQLYELSLTIP